MRITQADCGLWTGNSSVNKHSIAASVVKDEKLCRPEMCTQCPADTLESATQPLSLPCNYQIGQNVRSGLSVRCYGKTLTTFWPIETHSQITCPKPQSLQVAALRLNPQVREVSLQHLHSPNPPGHSDHPHTQGKVVTIHQLVQRPILLHSPDSLLLKGNLWTCTIRAVSSLRTNHQPGPWCWDSIQAPPAP